MLGHVTVPATRHFSPVKMSEIGQGVYVFNSILLLYQYYYVATKIPCFHEITDRPSILLDPIPLDPAGAS